MRAAIVWGPIVVAIWVVSAGARGADPLVPAEAYLGPHQLVAVHGGRRLNLFCLGEGKPTVVLESGGGSPITDWRQVQAAIGQFTRVCAYERAGYGFSDASGRAADVTNSVDDLHRLVGAAGIERPVVLVGHSIGGLYATSYAATYPDEVAGMVLLDPSFVRQGPRMAAHWTPAEIAAFKTEYTKATGMLGKCLDLARTGELAKPENQKSECMDNPPNPDPTLHRVLNEEYSKPGYVQAVLSEALNDTAADPKAESRDDVEALGVAFKFADKTLIVLTAGAEEIDPQMQMSKTTWDVLGAVSRAGHEELAAKSRRGVHVVVPKSGHFIQKDQPAVVIRYVRAAVEAVRNQ
jgi:pimeloyl-ACP methyl ester carboxylesterase